jgi:predicted nucleic acid-binding protein
LIVAVDTSAFSRTISGEKDQSTAAVRAALKWNLLRVPPVVITELLSNVALTDATRRLVLNLPVLEIIDGYWVRAGFLRADASSRARKAKLADCLIAQSCIDYDIPLITYDRDFRHFVRAGLTFA